MRDFLPLPKFRQWIAVAGCAGVLGTPVCAGAQPRAAAASRAAAAQDSSGQGGAQDGDEGQLPPDHPPVENPNPRARSNASRAGTEIFEPPEDTEREDPGLAAGTIVVELRDGDGMPVVGEGVTLGILINSIAKGDSRKRLMELTDDRGTATFAGLDTASNIAYRVSSGHQGGSFAAMPFQLSQGKAMRVVLHVYPVTHDIQSTLILCEAVVAAELRDDRIQIEEALTFYNLGRQAWQPEDVAMPLPHGFTAFASQPSMSDQGVDVSGETAKLHGTFAPGHHPIQFRWQLPWSGDKDIDFEVGMPPHVAIARVLMPASSGVKLAISGFPPTDVRRDAQGQSFLVSERRVHPDEPKVRFLDIGIHDLPTPGPARVIATLLAAFGVATGIAFLVRKRSRRDNGRSVLESREALLEELGDLEDARAAGEVGPRTYERARRELMDSIALTIAHQ